MVTCYKNTGLNAVNIPETPAFLTGNFDSVTFNALDILQIEGLDSISVNATYEQVRDVDYCMLYDGSYAAFYAVGTPVMTSTDVAVLPLTYDAITSSGGPASIEYLDGITERHTTGDDTMFKYTTPDEYTVPREALQLVSGGMLFNDKTVSHTPVESTLDLQTLGGEFNDDGTLAEGSGITFVDVSGNEVTVPWAPPLTARTQYYLGTDTDAILSPNTRLYENQPAQYAKVEKALAAIRSLSMEQALISQVAYPDQFVTCQVGAEGQYSSVTGKDQSVDSGLNFQYASVNNKRVLYGEYNKFGLMTAAGSKGEYLPEQIGDSSDTSPEVRSIADPRPDGKPYFRFRKYLSESGDMQFWVACVEGLQWNNVPLVYYKADGTALNTLNFNNAAQAAQSAYTYNQNIGTLNTVQTATNAALSAAGTIAGSWGIDSVLNPGKAVQNTLSGANTIINGVIDTSKNVLGMMQQKSQYNLAREKELQNYAFSQAVVAPQVLFPFNANVIRDFIGNGVFVYRYRYSASDITRIDKLLTMYGYKDTVALTADLFNQRTYFDYVRASGISVGGDIPMWRKSLIAEQLNAGVRVWHVKPSASYYASGNPIK